MIFSMAGFHPELEAVAAQRADVRLVGLPALFGQSPPGEVPPGGTPRTA
jgi:hypothetical protein